MNDISAVTLDSDSSFSTFFKGLRKKLLGKQVVLSREIGCTEAAVSYWETGKRLPNRHMMDRIIAVLQQSGAAGSELIELQGGWRAELLRRYDAVSS